MVYVISDRVSPVVTGTVYCSVIAACFEIFDLGRAKEWTGALDEWSRTQPDASPFRGQCLVFRAEIMSLRGEWARALEEVVRAAEHLSQPPPHAAAGRAFYQEGELHRLRGEVGEAERAYARSAESGESPQPGLALLRLSQGRPDAARAALQRELDESKDLRVRCRLLPAVVEVMLASGEEESARIAAAEMSEIGEKLSAPLVDAMSAHCEGAILLEGGDPRAALGHLRRALRGWLDLEAPFGAARTRVLIGLACRLLGDLDTAEVEVIAARRAFEELGAVPALTDLERLSGPRAPAGGLTGRELEVLALPAAGKTNREIARELGISEKTVARHVSNIFVKIGVSSRAGATAYAYQHDLV